MEAVGIEPTSHGLKIRCITSLPYFHKFLLVTARGFPYNTKTPVYLNSFSIHFGGKPAISAGFFMDPICVQRIGPNADRYYRPGQAESI